GRYATCGVERDRHARVAVEPMVVVVDRGGVAHEGELPLRHLRATLIRPASPLPPRLPYESQSGLRMSSILLDNLALAWRDSPLGDAGGARANSCVPSHV